MRTDIDNKVLLLSMPFGPLLQPSIGLSLLRGSLAGTKHNISVGIRYLTLPFGAKLGLDLYQMIHEGAPGTPDLVGEWLFSEALFGNHHTGDVEGYVQTVLLGRSKDHRKHHSRRWNGDLARDKIDEILRVRSYIPAFLDRCVADILTRKPKLIGFTSTFQQHVASLALAKQIKSVSPKTLIMFGGANCEGIMGVELVQRFPFVDVVVSGPGDLVFPELVTRLLDDAPLDSLEDLPGVFTKANVSQVARSPMRSRSLNAPPVANLDALPIPDYDDFFEQLHQSGLSVPDRAVRLPFETSRGCWWGEKHHCTFCGLNGSTLAYRSKSADRALSELLDLAERYPGHPISVVDNILDMKYFKSLVPWLAEKQLDLNLFYEVKANLSKAHIQLLKEAGITIIQPGIESFSNNVLSIMRKGVDKLQNIQLLKWCAEYGITPQWNIIWGFPGETPEDYQEMADLIPNLTHLRPPVGRGAIRLDRFSPNFDYAEQLGFANVRPYPSAFYIYAPLPEGAIHNLSYHFTFDYAEPRDVDSYTASVAECIDEWRQVHQKSALFFVDKGQAIIICDTRPKAKQMFTALQGPQRHLYVLCDKAQSVRKLQEQLAQDFDVTLAEGEIDRLLEPLVEQGLMVRDKNSFLSLAIPVGFYTPSKEVLEVLRASLNPLAVSPSPPQQELVTK